MKSGILYIVSTPLGNLEDITLRALKTLKEVDFIAAEDTRHSLKLLNYYNIKKPLISYWSEKEKIRAEQIIGKLKAGESGALISDAGTPGISDPGAVLIKRAIEEDISLIPVPGASALIVALSVSGLSTENFLFLGFLPPKTIERQQRLRELALESKTMVFYEAPHRIIETLSDISEILGDRKAAIAREVTKLHEEVLRGRLSDLLKSLENKKIAGEFVIIISGCENRNVSFDEALQEIRLMMKKGMGRKEAVKIIAEQYGLSKKELYDRSLKK